jgi:hypothetical protein
MKFLATTDMSAFSLTGIDLDGKESTVPHHNQSMRAPTLTLSSSAITGAGEVAVAVGVGAAAVAVGAGLAPVDVDNDFVAIIEARSDSLDGTEGAVVAISSGHAIILSNTSSTAFGFGRIGDTFIFTALGGLGTGGYFFESS